MSCILIFITMYLAIGTATTLLGMIFYARTYFRFGFRAMYSAVMVTILLWPAIWWEFLLDFVRWVRRTFFVQCIVLLLGWHLAGSQPLGGGWYRLTFKHWTGVHRTVVTDDPNLKGGAL